MLCVKLAVAVGPMCLTYVGLPSDKQFDLSGTAVDDVGLTEKRATPGAIILSQLAWANCDQNLFDVTSMEEGQFFKVNFYIIHLFMYLFIPRIIFIFFNYCKRDLDRVQLRFRSYIPSHNSFVVREFTVFQKFLIIC